jgi:SEC-C motif-containing protein
MRSRYAAYALGKTDYIIQTTHPKSVYFEADRQKWERAILQFSQRTKFIRLEIDSSGENWVSFTAHMEENGIAYTLKEKSYFEKANGRWAYLSGEISIDR